MRGSRERLIGGEGGHARVEAKFRVVSTSRVERPARARRESEGPGWSQDGSVIKFETDDFKEAGAALAAGLGSDCDCGKPSHVAHVHASMPEPS